MKLRLTVLRIDDPIERFDLDIEVKDISPGNFLYKRIENDKIVNRQIANSFADMILLHLNKK